MSKTHKPTIAERLARALHDYFYPPKLHIRLRKRKAGDYWQVCRGREVIAQFSAAERQLGYVKAAYPTATYTEPKAKTT